jgi:hypothetical protein
MDGRCGHDANVDRRALAMRNAGHLLKLLAAQFILVAALALGANAQDAEGEFEQIKLSEAQVKNYLAAQPDLVGVDERIAATGDEPAPELEAELNTLAAKHGFKDFNELNVVAANISLVLAGMNPETGEFIQPAEAFKKELEEIKSDDSIPAAEKKELVEELTDAIESTPPVKHMENVELIKANREAIVEALE